MWSFTIVRSYFTLCCHLFLVNSLKGRLNSIKSVINAMRKRVITDFLSDRHETLADALERSLKKGQSV